MARIITVGAAQLGPIARVETRAQVVDRMLALMNEAKRTKPSGTAATWSCSRSWR